MKHKLYGFSILMVLFSPLRLFTQQDSLNYLKTHSLTGNASYYNKGNLQFNEEVRPWEKLELAEEIKDGPINQAVSDEAPSGILQMSELTGSWWGFREKMNDHGFNFSLSYMADILSGIVSGASSEAYYLDNISARLSIDLQKTLNMENSSLLISFLGNNGGNPAEATGTAQGISNIESVNDFKLYELRFEKLFMNEELSILAGLYDLNSEFDVRESSKLFVNPSHGIGADFAQSGQNGPSIFPHTSLALRLKYTRPGSFYIQSAVFDGVPGNPSNPYGTHVILNKEDGLLMAFEGGLQKGDFARSDDYLKISGGFWYYNSDYDDLYDLDSWGNPVRKRGNFGLYASAETFLYSENSEDNQGAAMFLRAGSADEDINQFSLYTAAGINFIGLIPGRNSDQLGFAVAGAHNGVKYRKMADSEGLGVRHHELNLELTYSANILPWLRVQPDFQLILNPAGRSDGRSIFSAGTRLEIIL